MMKYIAFLFFLISLLPFNITLAAEQETGLLSFVQSAIDNNYALSSSKESVESQRLQTKVSRNSLLPSLSLSGSSGLNDSTTFVRSGADTKDDYESYDYSLSLSQSLFNAKSYLTYKSAKINFSNQKLQYKKTKIDTINSVVSSYFSYLKSLAQIRTIRLEISSAEERLRQLKRSFELGNVAKTDVLEAQSNLESILVRMVTQQQGLKIAKRQLYEISLLSQTPNYDINLEMKIENIDKNKANQFNEIIGQNNYDILIAKKSLELSKNEVSLSDSEFAPTVTLNGSHSHSFSGSSSAKTETLTGHSESSAITLNVAVPLFTGGKYIYGSSKARKDRYIAQIDLKDTINSTKADLDEIIYNINTNVESIATLEKTIYSNQESYKSLKRSYEIGLRSLTDVLVAQTRLYNSIRDYYDKRYDYLINFVDFHRINGILDIEIIRKLDRNMSVFNPNEPLIIPSFDEQS